MGKSIKVSVRMNEEQFALLKRKMQSENLKNYSECIRRLIDSENPGAHPDLKKLLKELIYQEAKIGQNINQIVKSSNSYLYRMEDKAELKELMRKLTNTVQEFSEKF